jgi:hypothetical protein
MRVALNLMVAVTIGLVAVVAVDIARDHETTPVAVSQVAPPTTMIAPEWDCHDVGPYTDDALPGNLAQMSVAFYLEPGHDRLCVAPEVSPVVEAERAAIVAAGGWGG